MDDTFYLISSTVPCSIESDTSLHRSVTTTMLRCAPDSLISVCIGATHRAANSNLARLLLKEAYGSVLSNAQRKGDNARAGEFIWAIDSLGIILACRTHMSHGANSEGSSRPWMNICNAMATSKPSWKSSTPLGMSLGVIFLM